MSKSDFTMKLAVIPANAPLMLKESMTRMNAIAESAQKNILDRSAILHDLSVELSFIGEKKLYEQTQNKSLAEFAEQRFGIEKSMTYTLSRAGTFYRSDKVPNEVKALPPTTLSQLSALDTKDEQQSIYDRIISGDISTQKEVRDAIKEIKDSKPKTPKFYCYHIEGKADIYAKNAIFNADTAIEYPTGERFNLMGRFTPFAKPAQESGASDIIYLAVDENGGYTLLHTRQLSKAEYNAKMEELSKPQPLTKEERIALLMKQLEELQAE